MKAEKISELTIDRLSIYLRCLNHLANQRVKTISSQELAEQFNLNSAQIRKDLAQFGEFGVRGVGYSVENLRDCLKRILGLDQGHSIGIIGAGNLGMALADYEGFNGTNFSVVALFDTNPEKINMQTKFGVPVLEAQDLKGAIKRLGIDLVVLAVPASDAQAVLSQVLEAGIKAVLNFAPIQLAVPEGVKVKTVDLTISFDSLSHALAGETSIKDILIESSAKLTNQSKEVRNSSRRPKNRAV